MLYGEEGDAGHDGAVLRVGDFVHDGLGVAFLLQCSVTTSSADSRLGRHLEVLCTCCC